MILKTIGGRKRGQIHLFESSDIQVVAPKELAWKAAPGAESDDSLKTP